MEREPAVGDEPDEEPQDRPRPQTTDPHRSRLRAVKILFQADLRDRTPSDHLALVDADPAAAALLDDRDGDADDTGGALSDDPAGAARAAAGERVEALDGYTRRLVLGVDDDLAEIDGLLGDFSRHWAVHRMAVIDRNVLRLGVYELLHEQVSPAIVIDEAVELVKELSTEDSHRFVNGILDSVRQWSEGRADGGS